MTIKTSIRKRTRQAALATLALGVILSVTGLTSSPASAAVNPHQITICHSTGSGQFSSPTPAKWQITEPNGHGWDADDVIPAFDAGSHGGKTWAGYPGLNLDRVFTGGLTGRQILDQGCSTVVPPAGSITLDKVTAGDGQPVDTTSFPFTVTCETEAGVVPTAAPSVAPADVALVVASGLAEGDSCTITETDARSAASTSHSVAGGATDEAGTAVTVTVTSATDTVAVVFTNTYECAEGATADGQGGCVPPCQPTTENNQCVPCETGAADGQGGCPVDVCANVTGTQTSVSECPVEVQGEVITRVPVTPVTPVQAAEVQAAQAVRAAELPRTGAGTERLAAFGFGLLLVGAGLVLLTRDETATA